MSTLGIIDTHVANALKATTVDEKLDEIAARSARSDDSSATWRIG
jgi:hypothetical protein